LSGPSKSYAFGGSFKKLENLPDVKNENDDVHNITSDDSPKRSRSRSPVSKPDIHDGCEENVELKE